MPVPADNLRRIESLEAHVARLRADIATIIPAVGIPSQQTLIGKTVASDGATYPTEASGADTFAVIFRDESFDEIEGKQDLSGDDQSSVFQRICRTIPSSYIAEGTYVIVVKSDDQYYIVGCCGSTSTSTGTAFPCICLQTAGRGISLIQVNFGNVKNGPDGCVYCSLWNNSNIPLNGSTTTPPPEGQDCRFMAIQAGQPPIGFFEPQVFFPCTEPDDSAPTYLELFVSSTLPCEDNINVVTLDVYIKGCRLFTAVWQNINFSNQQISADEITIGNCNGVGFGLTTGSHTIISGWDPRTGDDLKHNVGPGCRGYRVDFVPDIGGGWLHDFGDGPIELFENDYVIYDGARWVVIPRKANGSTPFDVFLPCELTALLDPNGCDWKQTVQEYGVRLSFIEAQG